MKYFLEKRFGCRGAYKTDLKQRLKMVVANENLHQEHFFGLSDDEMQQLSEQFEFHKIAALCYQRGNEQSLKQIAWYGSMLADISCTNQTENKKTILIEAALFNLGICLFDTIIDEIHEKKYPLISTINLEKIKNKLHCPMSAFSKIENTQDPLIQLIAKIFDAVFESIGNRNKNLDIIFSLISKMYESEIETSDDKISAKYLPIIFIGQLSGNPHLNQKYKFYFAKLSELLYQYDDWIDLGDDALKLKTNYFLLSKNKSYLLKINQILEVFKRVLFSKKFRKTISSHLHFKLNAVIEASKKLEYQSQQKNLFLLHKILS